MILVITCSWFASALLLCLRFSYKILGHIFKLTHVVGTTIHMDSALRVSLQKLG